MIDHVTLRVSDFEASKAFYTRVLAPLGHELAWEDKELHGAADHGAHDLGAAEVVLLGVRAEWGDFSIAADGKPLSENVHIAFAAKSREEVDAFHRAAVGAGYRDNGAPGERPVYHVGYYGAFVLDPDGNNVEAVFHDRRDSPGAGSPGVD